MHVSKKRIGLCAQIMITILGSVINITKVGGDLYNEHENLHFDNEQNIHTTLKTTHNITKHLGCVR